MIYGRLAQLGERLPYKQNVSSSILLSPTKKKASCDPLHAVFFLAFSLFSPQSYNLLHPRLTTFCASLCSFKMCSLRNQFDPVIAHHNEKFHVLRAVGFFIAIFTEK